MYQGPAQRDAGNVCVTGMTPSFTRTPDASRPRVFANWIGTVDPMPAARVAAALVSVEQGDVSRVARDADGRFRLEVPGSWGCLVVFGRPEESLASALSTL